MSSIDYKHLTVSELKCLSKSRSLDVGGRKNDLIARLVNDDIKNCSIDVLKVLLKNRGLPTGGIKKDLQQRLVVACSSGGASLLPGTLEAVSSPSSMVPKLQNKSLVDTTQGSNSGSQFQEAENSVFPGLGMEVVTKKVKRETETVSTIVSHGMSTMDWRGPAQDCQKKMSFSPVVASVSKIMQTPICGQNTSGCLVTPKKNIVGSKQRRKIGVGLNVQGQGKKLSEFNCGNMPGPVARSGVTPKKQTGNKRKIACEQEVREQGIEEFNGIVANGQKKSKKVKVAQRIEKMVYMESGDVMDPYP